MQKIFKESKCNNIQRSEESLIEYTVTNHTDFFSRTALIITVQSTILTLRGSTTRTESSTLQQRDTTHLRDALEPNLNEKNKGEIKLSAPSILFKSPCHRAKERLLAPSGTVTLGLYSPPNSSPGTGLFMSTNLPNISFCVYINLVLKLQETSVYDIYSVSNRLFNIIFYADYFQRNLPKTKII